MIATLTGVISDVLFDKVVIDVNGVGYGIVVSASDQGALPSGKQTKLYIHEHIREDSHDLYGFCELQSQALFEQLLTAKGVGPKGAMSILSVGSINDIRAAIARGDTAFIARAQGVGKRVAERIVVDLKDKVGMPSAGDATSFLQAPSSRDDAVQALVALGYSEQDAVLALKDVDQSLSTEERIKKALSR